MLALLALGLPALAFAPVDDAIVGAEPAKTRRFHVERQHALRHGAAWQAFVNGDGAGWLARFDEATGQPVSAWGPPIDLGIATGGASAGPDVVAALRGLFERNQGLLGLPLDQLDLQTISHDAATDTWTLRLVQVLPDTDLGRDSFTRGSTPLPAERILDPLALGGGLIDKAPAFSSALDADGLPVWGGSLELRVANGRLAWFSSHLQPAAGDVLAGARTVLAADTAAEVAVSDGPWPHADHQLIGTRLVVMPVELLGDDARFAASAGLRPAFTLAYEVRTRTTDPAGLWVSFVDAGTGALLNVHNDVRYVAGTLTAVHDTRTVDGDFSESPLVELLVVGDAADDAMYTDEADGSYDLSASSTITATLTGSWLRVVNQGGAEAQASFSGDFTWTDDDATQAELDTYVFLNQVFDWKDTHAPEVSTGGRLTSNVNINSSCNAYFDGSVNFYKSGGSCNNTGRIADVNFHEWGHGFHYYSLEAGSFDGSVSEGIGDTVSALLTGDHRIGPHFYTSGGAIRELSTDKVYPDDVTGEVHADGLIFGGAIWDLWTILDEDLGAEDGYDETVRIFKNAIKLGPDIEGSYDAAILGDDDNGDLSDGTPNQCAILEAFAMHGLGPSGSAGLVGLSHLPLGNQPAGAGSYAITADVQNMAPDCIDFDLATAQVHYSIDDGATWEIADLTLGDGTVEGAIPAQPAGTIVHYFIDAVSSEGSQTSVPSGRFINAFTFVVGDLVEIYCEDFEADDGGYTHALLDGEEQLGADDWIWDTPRGYADDPEFAASGTKVWGNDLGGGNYNGEYQPDKHNRLQTIPIDVAGYDRIVVQYQRWLAVEDGYWDTAQIVQIFDEDDSDDYEVVWQNYGSPGGSSVDHSDHHADEQWTLHSVEVDVPETGELIVGWDIVSDGGLEFGGWNVDDVCVYAIVDGGGDTGGAGDGGSSDGGSSDGGSSDGGGDTGVTGDGGGDGGQSADAGDDGDDWSVQARGCGCSAGPGSAAPALGFGMLLAGLVSLRRRREG